MTARKDGDYMIVNGGDGRPDFTVLFVGCDGKTSPLTGEPYGPKVKFYNRELEGFGEQGQFAAGYYLSTLTETPVEAMQGLDIHSAVPDWTIDAEGMTKVMAWLTADDREWDKGCPKCGNDGEVELLYCSDLERHTSSFVAFKDDAGSHYIDRYDSEYEGVEQTDEYGCGRCMHSESVGKKYSTTLTYDRKDFTDKDMTIEDIKRWLEYAHSLGYDIHIELQRGEEQ